MYVCENFLLDTEIFLFLLESLIFFPLTLSLTEKAYGDDGCLKQPKELSINKVGHGKYGHCVVIFS
jgi:hypothetical protein